MADKIRITTPLTEEQSRKLKVGDSVLISGVIYSARDAAHKVMTETLARGEKTSKLIGAIKLFYYLGPTPAKPGNPNWFLRSYNFWSYGRLYSYNARTGY